MKKKSASQSAFFNLRLLTGLFLALAGVFQFGNPSAAFSGNYSVEEGACGWSAGSDMPSVGVRAVGVYFPPNGKFYAVGGRASDSAGSDFTHPFEYDPASNTWTTKSATYLDNQVNNMSCGVLNDSGTDYIYCVGGSAAGATTATDRVFRYDPISDTISAVGASWPGDADQMTLPGGFSVFNNKLYILGGFQINLAMTDQIWEFTPPSSWVQKNAVLPVQRGYVPATTIGSFIYTAGGSFWDGTTLQDTTDSFKYDPAADSITSIASIPRATAETRALNFNGEMYVMGGGRTAPNPSNEVDIYDPGSNSWSTGDPFVTARRNFPTDTDGTNRIWLAGGYASDNVTLLSSMEIFNCTVVGDLNLVSAASVKGSFAIDLPLSGPSGVEDRSGGANKKYTVVMTFDQNIVSVGGASSTCGEVQSIVIDGQNVSINLVNVAHACDGSTITVTADSIADDQGNVLDSASVPMGLLLGDVNGDRVVNRSDTNAAQMHKGQKTVQQNFRYDVNANGHIEQADVTLIRQQQGNSLP